MRKNGRRSRPALYTTGLIYIAVQVAMISFLSSYYNYGIGNATQWAINKLDEYECTRNKLDWIKEFWHDAKESMKFPQKKGRENLKRIEAEVQLDDEGQVLTPEQLSLFDGSRPSRPVYLAILGRVYDVDKGKKHYGKGGGYYFFAGKDATRAFVTGDFTEKGLIDDTESLSHDDLLEEYDLGIRDWVSFYEKDYKLVGVVTGRYYDNKGKPTVELQKVFPPCNSEWHQNSGGRVWCSTKSGGIQREWAGVPRLLYDANTKQQRCACVKNFGPGLSNTPNRGANNGDLDYPALKILSTRSGKYLMLASSKIAVPN
uniref:Cytochrome b5 heme-binding domain-containing protein n=1 Tax=Heterorhabditis bacteriophora TaxID=37862 RepID=A0A1I7XGD5_HETBA